MRFNIGLAMSVVVAFCLNVQATEWETDFAKASTNAVKSGRHLLLDFCGSDWCGWCMKLDKEVFNDKAFADFAKTNLICVRLDFPRQKKLSKALQEQNAELAQKYGVKGYPTVLVLSPTGDLIDTTGYQAGGAKAYVAYLKAVVETHEKNGKQGTGELQTVNEQAIGGFPPDWFYFGNEPVKRIRIDTLVGKQAPPLKLAGGTMKTGHPVDLKGKVVVVDLWATWCHVCLESIPKNNSLVKKYADKDFVFAAVCTMEGQEKLPSIVKEKGIEYPVATDPGNKIGSAWHASFYPTYAVLDRKGVVRAIGVVPDAVEKVVDKLLDEPADDKKAKE